MVVKNKIIIMKSLSEFFKEEENEDELIRRVKALSKENKMALLQILKNIK